jgi:hypothetical protein
MSNLVERITPANWSVQSNDGTTIVAKNNVTGEVFNGPLASYNAIFRASYVEESTPRWVIDSKTRDLVGYRKADGSVQNVVQSFSTPGGGVDFAPSLSSAIRRGLGYEPLRNVEWTELGASDVRPIASRLRDGYIYGTKPGGLLLRSADGGRTWEQVGTASLTDGNTPRLILPLGDGESLIVTARHIYRTSGWGSASVSVSLVLTSTTTAYFLEWGVDTSGQKCVATHYNASNYSESRHVWYSDDNGKTWRIIRDLNTDGKTNHHLHFATFDTYANDRIYISHHSDPGLGTDKSIEYTDDVGANWQSVPNITIFDDAGAVRTVQPTACVPTPDGMVFGSDDTWTGFFILRRGSAAIEKLVPGVPSVGNISVTGFATYCERDAESGDIYACWVQSSASSVAYVLASDGISGSVVYQMPVSYPISGFGGVQGLPGFMSLTMTGDELIVVARRPSDVTPTDNVYWMLRAPRPRRVAGRVYDPYDDSIVRVGAKWRLESPSIWSGAESIGGDSLAVGYQAKALNFVGCTVIGNNSTTNGQKNTIVGNGVTLTGQSFSVAVGDGAVISGANAVRIGQFGDAGVSSVSLGYDAIAYSGSVAIGREAKMSSGSADGVAIGRIVTGASFAVAIANGASVSTGGTSVGYNSGAGNGVAVGYAAKRSGTQTGIVAVGRDAICGANDTTALGKSANAGHLNAVALGAGTSTARADSVAVGARDVELQGNNKGVILLSPNGTRYKLTVSDAGAVTVTEV